MVVPPKPENENLFTMSTKFTAGIKIANAKTLAPEYALSMIKFHWQTPL